MSGSLSHSPSDLALQVVDDLVRAEPSRDVQPGHISATGAGLRVSGAVAQRLANPGFEELGIASLCREAIRVVASGGGNPFSGFSEGDDPVIELYQWYRTQPDSGRARNLAALCIDRLCPELQTAEGAEPMTDSESE